ncbi:N-acyl-D-amino-acid deacylase family protein [Desulfospira joergensenii]|uniref:N-acyl-D-amino-acid deacylase family protein n=1 Tax=Desulfospira joergensenii TaxID=53329 RepID=UPI0003B5EF83|nr:D-aminoacylase [Desulfospira joergensenii]
MPDLIIKNVSVIDGTGRPAFASDIGITGGRISHVAANLNLDSPEILDGKGLTLCPGFIDIHTHSDFTLLLSPGAESRITQGVTTEVTGNCGGSPGPVCEDFREAFMEYMSDLGKHYKRELNPEDWNWNSLDEFYTRLSEQGTALNIVPLVGHSTLRANVMGYSDRPPRPDEIQKMKALLRDEMEKGIFGLSSGLVYHPGAFAQKGEMAELAGVLPRYEGVYSTHMRSEGKFLFEAVDEALSVARKSGASLEISHLKCESPAIWGKGALLLEKIDQARGEGLDVHFDQYPYTAYSTGLIEIFPTWAKEAGASRLKQILSNPKTRKQVARDMTSMDWDNPMEGLSWEDVLLTGFSLPENKGLNGSTVAEAARAKTCDPIETLFTLFCEEKDGLGMIVFAMSEEDLMTILQHPMGMIGSDGCSVTPGGITGRVPVHPRYYGTFPRVLARYVRKKKILSLELAVYKMTGLPAQKLGLKDRGRIEKGMAADLVLFDPDKVLDRADFTRPHQTAQGIPHVFVNGRAVVRDGALTGDRPGKRLYKN